MYKAIKYIKKIIAATLQKVRLNMKENNLKQLEQQLLTAFLLDNPDIEPRPILFEECSKIFQNKTKIMSERELNNMSIRVHERLDFHGLEQQKQLLKKLNKY